MAKKLPKFGVNVYHKRTPKKRPGRHAKSYSKRIPKEGQNFEAWTVVKDGNGAVQKAEYNPAKYRITYEDTKV